MPVQLNYLNSMCMTLIKWINVEKSKRNPMKSLWFEEYYSVIMIIIITNLIIELINLRFLGQN